MNGYDSTTRAKGGSHRPACHGGKLFWEKVYLELVLKECTKAKDLRPEHYDHLIRLISSAHFLITFVYFLSKVFVPRESVNDSRIFGRVRHQFSFETLPFTFDRLLQNRS